MPIFERFLNLCSPVEGFLDKVLYDEEYSDGFVTGEIDPIENERKIEDVRMMVKGNYSNKKHKVTVAWPTVEDLGVDVTALGPPTSSWEVVGELEGTYERAFVPRAFAKRQSYQI